MGQVIYDKNDNLLELDALKDALTGSFLNAATVTVTVVDKDGTNVVGQTWPTSMGYVAASDGKYRAVLEDVMTLTVGEMYFAQITADAGSGKKGYWVLPIAARERREM